MRLIVPAYYPAFRCIAGACRHSCCVGWEIDIDNETREKYMTLTGQLGAQVRRSLVTTGNTTCFRLLAGERCPHLNADGLCEIILGVGESYLSQICRDHPRYRTYFSDRVEIGLGLCCEEAARLILSWDAPITYITVEDDGEREALTPDEEEVLALRDACLAIACDRERTMTERLSRLAQLTPVDMPSVAAWAHHLAALERLDPAWDVCLDMLLKHETVPQNSGSAPYNIQLGAAEEQFLVYLLGRHLADAADAATCRFYIAFVILSCRTLSALAAVHHAAHGMISVDTYADYARMWSSEIEYSTENVEASLAYLAGTTEK